MSLSKHIIITRVYKDSNNLSEKTYVTILNNGIVVTKQFFVEDTEINREIFPVHRIYKGRLYSKERIYFVKDELCELASILHKRSFQNIIAGTFIKKQWFLSRFIFYIGRKFLFKKDCFCSK